ncbi:MAG: PH domain-containing protein [Sporichthyaceae bacterium]
MRGGVRLPLIEGERVAFQVRAHIYTLGGSAFILILTAGVSAFLAATVPDSDARPTLRLVIVGTALALIVRWVLWPFLGWYSRTYLVTDRRVIVREGVFSRRGHDLPLTRVVGATCTRTVLQRMFGCGRLVVATAGSGDLVVEDVPMVVEVQRVLAALTAAAIAAAAPAGAWEPGANPATAPPGGTPRRT